MSAQTPGIIRHYPALSGIIRHYPALSGIIRHYPALSGIIRHYPALSGIIRHYPALSGIITHFPLFPRAKTCRLHLGGALLAALLAAPAWAACTWSDHVLSGVIEEVDFGQEACNTTINSGGTQNVRYGGTATNTTINSGGTQNVRNGGTATNTVMKGGRLWLDTGAQLSGSLEVHGTGNTASLLGGSGVLPSLKFVLPAGMSAGDTMFSIVSGSQFPDLSSVPVTVIDDSGGNLPGMVTLINRISRPPVSSAITIPTGFMLDTSNKALVLRALYSITVDNGTLTGGSVKCDPTTDIAHGTGTSDCTAAEAPGYTFGGLRVASGKAEVNCNGLTCTVSNLESSIVLRPTFTEQFTVQVATGIANGSLTGCSPTKVNRGEDVTVTCTATADPGYDFSNMTLTDGASSNTCDATTCDLANVQGGVTVGATFTKRKYGVMVNSATGGSVKCDPDTDIEHGTGTSDCTATEDTGYTFGGMTVDSGTGDISCSGLVCTLSKLESNVTVQPAFTLNEYSVSDATPAGSGGSMNCASPVRHGESARCDAAPDAGYVFDTMDIDPPGKATLGTCDANGCELTGVVGDVTVTGVFKALPPTPQPQQPSDNGGATPQPRQPYVISNTPTMGEVGLLLSGLALAGAAAPALRRREKQGKKADTRQ